MPPNSCSSSGYGTVGGSPSQARIFMCDLAGAYAHEVGHNLGMHHASTPAYEFEDTTDPMAISGRWLRGLNAPHRHQMEWYGSNSVHLIDRSGTYDVAPLAMDPGTATAPQVLLIRKPDTGEYYYVSYRMPIGFDDQYIDLTYLEKIEYSSLQR